MGEKAESGGIEMEINKGSAYLLDGDLTYICIGYTDEKALAILAPFWADDGDMNPVIQDSDFLVVDNPYMNNNLGEITSFTVRKLRFE